MEVNELMIGDWVVRESHKNTPQQVIGIGDKGVTLKLEGGWCGEAIDLIEPIPLTPKILEKNEFYHEHNVGLVYEDGNGSEIIYSTFDNELKIIRDREVILRKQDWLFPVHELQHALRLAGIKKEIVL